jgi:hypothetical protein
MTLYSIQCPACQKSVNKRAAFCRSCFHVFNLPDDPKKAKQLLQRVERERKGLAQLQQQVAFETEQAANDSNALVCRECGFKTLRSLQTHIEREHNMKLSAYHAKHGTSAKDVLSSAIRQQLSEAVVGEKNPAYQHGGRFSPFSEKFIKYETEEQAKAGRAVIFAKTGAAQADHGSTKLKYYLDKGMTQAEAEAALKDRQQTFTLEKCIARWGAEIGKQKWNERQAKWLATLNSKSDAELEAINRKKIYKSGVSKVSKEFFSLLDCDGSRHFGRDKELCIKNTDSNLSKRHIFVDFAFGSKVIEFYGSYWHADPRKYKETDIIYVSKSKHLKAVDIWQADQLREAIIKANGYELLVIWELDYIQDPDKVIQQCKTFLHG